MKRLSVILFSAIFLIGLYSFVGGKYETLKIGSKAPMTDYKMESTSSKSMSLDDVKGANGTLVMFSCNTCPFVIQWEDRYPGLAEQAKKHNIGFALINSNEAKREGADSKSEMKKHADEKGYADIPYLVDQNSKLANAFGGKTTPHVFLFDADWKLVYEGAIDDNSKDAKAVSAPYLSNAMQNLVDGKPIDPNDTKAIGCSIKRVDS